MNDKQLALYNIKRYNNNNSIYNELSTSNFTELQKNILANRLNEEQLPILHDYTSYKLDVTKDMYGLKDLDKAGSIIAEHIRKGSNILSLTDLDADGLDSAAIGHIAFLDIFKLKQDVNFFTLVAHRNEGRGLSEKLYARVMELHKRVGIDLVVTADHMSSDEYNIKRLEDQGITVVLTDHHEIPKDNYPKSATVVVNPQREDNVVMKNISGCFVLFMTLLATYDKLHGKIDIELFDPLLPFVALTTISDVMSLKDPLNRKMVQAGFNEMNSLRNPLWLAMKTIFGINTVIDETEIGFKIAPMINTGNRMDKEELALSLLLSRDFNEATQYAKKFINLSKTRKEEQKRLFIEAELQITELNYDSSIALILKSDLAVNGIIAGQIGETYGRPTVCFIDSGKDIVAGSARGILEQFNIVEAFNKIHQEDNGILIKFGGHKMAAGCTVYKNRLEDFRRLFDKYVAEQVDIVSIDKTIRIDGYLNSDSITPYLVQDINRLRPYGKDWLYPTFATKMKVKYVNIYGSLIRFTFETNKGDRIDGMYFFNKNSTYNKSEFMEKIGNNINVIVVYKPYMNNFNGNTSLQLNVVDIQKER